ncbi:ubiquinol-cytochrome C reductase hinge domain-containing protein [Kockiozyma suomiensis]|uniref:ubiquinol-cytochrome C reductase hinge domain-containing protein n=1 Tax=Kockiozyma suomiensis TaxID=1337062 RepID=UPI003343363E
MSSVLREFFEAIVPVIKAEEPEEEEEAVEEVEEEEEEEEEEDPEDTMPAIQEECAEKACHSAKHHYEECVERVTAAQEEEDYAEREYKENCVEEFLHLSHCVNDCATGKIFATLK